MKDIVSILLSTWENRESPVKMWLNNERKNGEPMTQACPNGRSQENL